MPALRVSREPERPRASPAAPLFPTLVFCIALGNVAAAQVCTHPRDPGFYETNGYKIARIEIQSPFGFLFFVRHRLDRIKDELSTPIEGSRLAVAIASLPAPITAGFKRVEQLVQADGAFGTSRAKIAVATASLENCREAPGGPTTVDVVSITSSRPIPSPRCAPHRRTAATPWRSLPRRRRREHQPPSINFSLRSDMSTRAAALAAATWQCAFQAASWKISASRATARRPAVPFRRSSTVLSRRVCGRSTASNIIWPTTIRKTPAASLRLAKGAIHARVTGASKPIETVAGHIVLRYGGSVEQGNQQSNHTAALLPPDTIANSAYGGIRWYTGITNTTRYSETAVSYGFLAGGAGLDDLGFQKHVGDAMYSLRFPGRTHSPWDVRARFSAGGIGGSGRILLTERFFGGNLVSAFIPGDSWKILNGPLIRSIASNRLTGAGAGGTSFYSTNLTVGKVIRSFPLIPKEVETADGFASGVDAALNTAETFFADDYHTESPEYKALAVRQGAIFNADLNAVQATLRQIRAAGPVAPAVAPMLTDAEGRLRRVRSLISQATVPDARGRIGALRLRTLLNPRISLLQRLLDSIVKLKLQVDPAVRTQLESSAATIEEHVRGLASEIDEVNKAPRDAARERARRDMLRPREVIDTLRHEVNSLSFSVVGLFDAGRLWPDPYGTRYAVGMGGRVSVLNVNFTAGYAVNPHPRSELGQGRGALFVSLTYTNLFR